MSSENKQRLISLAAIVVSFLAGAMFVLGGMIAYQTYFPREAQKEVGVTTPAAPANYGGSQGSTLPGGIASTVKAVSPAIVNIETLTEDPRSREFNPFFNDPFFQEFFGNQLPFEVGPQVQRGLGTGFIINKEGYILTNEHVIHNAKEIKVKVMGFEEPLAAKVIGSDFNLDLAVLKIDAKKDLPYLSLGDSNSINVGDWVIAIGNPYGLDHTVTVGVISAKGRPVTISNREFKNLLQTDAAINPGNSGGPLLNLAGQVVGINTAVNAEAQGIGFAIPAATVKEVLKDLIEKGKVVRPYMGIYLQPLTPDLAQYFGAPKAEGALVGDVVPGGPAAKAGLRRGDIILKANKKPIKTSDELVELIKKSKVNTKLVLEVFRDGHIQYLSVVLAGN